jgi:hypothetical protein
MSELNQVRDDETLPEYSLEGGVRGKYADRFPPAPGSCFWTPTSPRRSRILRR